MEEYKNNGALVRLYLLGELAEEEQRRFEEELMSGDHVFEELLAAEDELIDQYVGGALTARERERFERHFLVTPERRRKLGFARTLRKYIADAGAEEVSVEGSTGDASSVEASPTEEASEEESADEEPSRARGGLRRPPSWERLLPPFLRARQPLARYALAAVLLLAIPAGGLLVFDALREPQRRGAVVAFTLAPGGGVRDTGGAGANRLRVPADAPAVELRLPLATLEHRNYRAVIENANEGGSVFESDELPPPAAGAERIVVVNVPADDLVPGDYRLRLRGANAAGQFEDAATYYFRVTEGQ
jgi:hypothetical protein